MNRADYMRRLAESLRRWVKLNTPFGVVAMPVGTSAMLVFPLNRRQTGYILLNAQTKLIEGHIDYEEIKSLTEEVAAIYSEGKKRRGCMSGVQASLSNIVIVVCFVFFFVMLVLLGIADGQFFVQTLCIFIVVVFGLVLWTLCS